MAFLMEMVKVLNLDRSSMREIFLMAFLNNSCDCISRPYILINSKITMFQKTIENNRLKNAEPLRLLSKLKEQKIEDRPAEDIFGVPMIESDASDHEDDEA